MSAENPWIRDLLDLKRTPRSGWFRAGVAQVESVAEHSFAVGLLAWQLAKARGMDASRALLMGLLHDFHEARLGDIPNPSKKHLPPGLLEQVEAKITAEQWGDDEPEVQVLLEEFSAGESELARLVRAADRLELLLQARRYRDAGYSGAEEFIAELETDPEIAELDSRFRSV